MVNILAIETSCDDTSTSVVVDGKVVSLFISSQKEHNEWGGVVPELASRTHLKVIGFALKKVLQDSSIKLSDLNAIAVTTEPGLVGSLLVGVNSAKGLSVALNIPLISVNHIEAHLLSVLIDNKVEFPFVGLVASGGHTLLYDVKGIGEYVLLGATRDDAAGEAFDKGAKMLGLGYPGGPMIDELSKKGDPLKYNFPRPLTNKPGLDFSFSGIKTALRYFLRDNFDNQLLTDQNLYDVCASYQEAIVETLIKKTLKSCKILGNKRIVVVGGCSANSRLKNLMSINCKKNIEFFTTKPIYSTDNAAMIGIVAYEKYKSKVFSDLTITAKSNMIRAKIISNKKAT